MDDFALLIDLHRGGARQGPGGDVETDLAITMSGLRDAKGLKIADVGSGTGAVSLVLASELDADITAVDFLPDFLGELERRARDEDLGQRITPLACSMDDMPFEDASLDAIWSEGAIYNIGFENGIRLWRRFLKPGGILAVSELTWLTAERPDEIDDHWNREYPEVATASAKLKILEAEGYAPMGYFPLPKRCWLENYYRPMQQRFEAFLERHQESEAAKAVVNAEQEEISLYERFSTYVGYGYYIARKLCD